MLAGLALVGSLTLLPISGAVHAAPAPGRANNTNGTQIVIQIPDPTAQGQIELSMRLENIAAVEGVSTTVLQQDLLAGETLLQIAGSRYSSAQALATALLANVKLKMDRAVAAGMTTAAQESQQYAAFLSAVETLVTTPHPRLTTRTDGSSGKGANPSGKGANVRMQVNFDLDQIASVLGVSTTTLQQDLQAGQTLLQIAGSKYSSAQALATALLANLKSKLDVAVTSGKLSAAQESQQYAALLSDTETLVTTPHPKLAAAGDAAGSLANVKAILISTLVTSCNTTQDALEAALQAGGKSLLAVCQVTNANATVASLSTAIVSAVQAQLAAAVSSGKITASQESSVLGELQAQLPSLLTTPVNVASAGSKS
jgi:hypothetical protein